MNNVDIRVVMLRYMFVLNILTFLSNYLLIKMSNMLLRGNYRLFVILISRELMLLCLYLEMTRVMMRNVCLYCRELTGLMLFGIGNLIGMCCFEHLLVLMGRSCSGIELYYLMHLDMELLDFLKWYQQERHWQVQWWSY